MDHRSRFQVPSPSPQSEGRSKNSNARSQMFKIGNERSEVESRDSKVKGEISGVIAHGS